MGVTIAIPVAALWATQNNNSFAMDTGALAEEQRRVVASMVALSKASLSEASVYITKLTEFAAAVKSLMEETLRTAPSDKAGTCFG